MRRGLFKSPGPAGARARRAPGGRRRCEAGQPATRLAALAQICNDSHRKSGPAGSVRRAMLLPPLRNWVTRLLRRQGLRSSASGPAPLGAQRGASPWGNTSLFHFAGCWRSAGSAPLPSFSSRDRPGTGLNPKRLPGAGRGGDSHWLVPQT